MPTRSKESSHPSAAEVPVTDQPPVDPGVLALASLLAPAIRPALPVALPREALRKRLLDRVALSAQEARHFTTVRRRDDHWHAVAPGVERKTLMDGHGARRWLLHLAAGASVSPSRVWNEEGLDVVVLSGALVAGTRRRAQGDFLSAEADATAEWQIDRAGGALLYLRQTLPEVDTGGSDPAAPVQNGDGHWRDLDAGVTGRLLRFRQHADRLEGWVLLRCAPGGSIPAHPHSQDEEAVMVSGDAFIGDILLCAGDFQFAPADTAHREIRSEHGCLLFVHGALNPARWQTPI